MKWPSLERKPETVKGAVVRYNGENFVDENHTKAWDALTARYPEMRMTPEREEARGWLTSRNRIVDDNEAYAIKVQSGQISPEKKPESELLERIKCAAIKYKDEYFIGTTHADAWRDMTGKYPETVLSYEHGDRLDGFMTDTDRFVDRKEALEIALKADQIADNKKGPALGETLASEDLKKERGE